MKIEHTHFVPGNDNKLKKDDNFLVEEILKNTTDLSYKKFTNNAIINSITKKYDGGQIYE